jgi:hypothetical protein
MLIHIKEGEEEDIIIIEEAEEEGTLTTTKEVSLCLLHNHHLNIPILNYHPPGQLVKFAIIWDTLPLTATTK